MIWHQCHILETFKKKKINVITADAMSAFAARAPAYLAQVMFWKHV